MLNSKKFTRLMTLCFFAFFLIPAGLWACGWDYDTLEMERSRFPNVLELITGKFARHSQEFYRWRIENRLKRLEQEPQNVALYDDMGVAYDKLGDHEKAIETMLHKEELEPGLYETAANLGTFYIHNGELEKGVEELKQAIEINPDAHFGREIYQVLLVEYVLSKQVDGKLSLPLSYREDNDNHFEQNESAAEATNFVQYVLLKRETAPEDREKEIAAATTGVLGMMRFGNYSSPILLEALGDLLGAGLSEEKRLPARAYLKASMEVEDPQAKSRYRQMAEEALSRQTVSVTSGSQLTLEVLSHTFEQELQEADAWWNGLRSDELSWIELGGDVDRRFSEKYFRSVPPLTDYSNSSYFGINHEQYFSAVILLMIFVLLLAISTPIVAVYCYLRFRRRKLMQSQAVGSSIRT